MKKCSKVALFALMCLLLAGGRAGAENTRLVRSIIFPGMGHLGEGQTSRGLLYMAGEAALLTLTFTNVARHSAYVRRSVYDSVMVFNEGGRAEDRQRILENWEQTISNAQRAKTMAGAFGGAAIVWWVWSVVDGILFTPEDAHQVTLYNKIRRSTVVAVAPDNALIRCTLDF